MRLHSIQSEASIATAARSQIFQERRLWDGIDAGLIHQVFL
jgi:hypothetical protein